MELRIFISSTFRDLEDERQHLAKKVFPAIRQRCRERGVEFTEIDLRWGLTEEEARLGKVIRTCLEEIDRCRPYFIGIIGSRYGWIPESHEVQRDPYLMRSFPFIEDSVAGARSLVEIEFEHAALRDPASAENAFFYNRRHHHHQMPSAEDEEKLEALRSRIRGSGFPMRDFSGPESLGEQIYDDLMGIIERNWKPNSELSPLERERREHENFASTRRHAYIADPKNLAFLSEKTNASKSVVLFGESGFGKSALLAYWSRYYADRNPKAHILPHYVGIGSFGGDHVGVLSHLTSEIREISAAAEAAPSEPERLTSEFPGWLARLGGETKSVIVIDALNELDERSHHLGWLPEHLPENVSIVCSTTSPEMLVELQRRGFETLELDPLNYSEREAIIVRYLSEYHKALSVGQIARIASDEKCAVPLFLRTVLEELRTSANFEQLDALVAEYMSVGNLDELFQRVLERMEEDYGARTVREVMGLLWASKHGLAEHELGQLLSISRMKLAAFLMALDYHLHRQSGMLSFFHQYLRRAVEMRYAATAERRKHLHTELAKFMRTQEPSDRRADEELWQWKAAGDHAELRATLTNPELVEISLRKEHIYDTLGYWRLFEEDKNGSSYIEEYTSLLVQEKKKKDLPRYEKLLERVADFFFITAHYNEAEKLRTERVDICKKLYGDRSAETAQALGDYGELLYQLEKSDEAKEAFTTAFEIYSNLFGTESSQAIDSLENLGAVLIQKKDYVEGEKIFRKTLPTTQLLHGFRSEQAAETINNIAVCLQLSGKLEEAEPLFREAIEIYEDLLGKEHPLLAMFYTNLGMVYLNLARWEDSRRELSHAFGIRLHTFGGDHVSTIDTMNKLGLALTNLERYDEARTYLEEARQWREHNLGWNHRLTLESLVNLGRLARAEEQSPEGVLPYFEEVVKRGVKEHHLFVVELARTYKEMMTAQNREDLIPAIDDILRKYNCTTT